MKIAIIGSGGREHALVHHLSNSKKITKIYSIPGNAGTEEISLNIDINLENFQDLYDFIYKEQIELGSCWSRKTIGRRISGFSRIKKY